MRIFVALQAFMACAIFIPVSPLAAEPLVNFVPQVHPNPYIYKEFDDRVAASQFEVLRALARMPKATVFVEGLTEDIEIEPQIFVHTREFGPIAPIMTFYGQDPNFLARRYDDLTRAQKVLLYQEGGVNVAYDLRLIGKMKAVDSSEEHERDMAWVRGIAEQLTVNNASNEDWEAFVETDEFQSRVMSRRELAALTRIRDYVKSPLFKGEPLAIVYGGRHQFSAAAKFDDSFEFNFTRACENRVIHLPDRSQNKIYF